ncbi:MAG TPA: response regulator [Phycisphaerae bacterium]|nr:response regulator [Phycisphaerae bacterium]HNU46767.1 response regulator [Phycisphaerae bacterium]
MSETDPASKRTGTTTLRNALRESEERLDLVLRGSNDGFWDWDVTTGELFLSARWLEMLGYAEADLEPHIRTFENLCHAEDLPGLREAMRAQLNAGAAQKMVIEHRLRTKSGEWKWILTRGAVGKRDEHARALRMAGTATDITDRKHAEVELQQHRDFLDEIVAQRTAQLQEANAQLQFDIGRRQEAEKRLREANAKLAEALEREKRISAQLKVAMEAAEAANRAKSEFLANMSHELRTPMTAILGFAEVLLKHGDLDHAPAERVEAVETIRRNGEYLMTIINDILDLSKIEAGKMRVEQIACSPVQIVSEVAALMRVRAEAQNLSFTVEYAGPVPETIQTDPTRLRQVLINLVGNAVKFTEAGSVRLAVRFVPDAGAPLMQFDIVDTGVGMSPEQATELFQPFTQADTSTTRRFGGTGLGLTISRRFAVLLGGNVTVVDTAVHKGTHIRLAIAAGSVMGVKMVDPGTVRPAPPPEPDRTPAPAAELCGCRVLLAEDGPDNQRLISFLLRKAGAEVSVAENGQVAVDKALAARGKGRAFDVILMDMQMPVLSGYDATARLRAEGYRGPIVALTAHAMEGDREKCVSAGCDDYATKPVDQKRLIATIRAFLTPTVGAR